MYYENHLKGLINRFLWPWPLSVFSLRSRLLWLRTWVSHTRQDLYHLAFDDGGNKDLTDNEVFLQAAQKLFTGHVSYRSISLYRPDWSLIVRYPEGSREKTRILSADYKKKLEKPDALFVVGQEYGNGGKDVILPVGQKLLGRDGEPRVSIVAEINLSRSLDRILGDTSDLEEGGRCILVTEGGKVVYVSNLADPASSARNCRENTNVSAILTSSP